MPRRLPTRIQGSSSKRRTDSRAPQQVAQFYSPAKRREDDTGSSEESEDSDGSEDEEKGDWSDTGRDTRDVTRPQQSNTTLLIIIGVLILFVGAGASYLYWEHVNGTSAGQASADSSAEGPTTAHTTIAVSGPTSSKSASASAPSSSSKPSTSGSRPGGADDSSRSLSKDLSTTEDPNSTISRISKSSVGVEPGGSTTSTASSSSTTLSTFAKQAVDAHNAVRSTHHAPDVSWDDSLASYADNWAHGCVFEHSGGPHGENLWAVFPAQDQLTDPTDGINSWASEESQYDYNNPGFNMNTGHFTQLVWVGSTKIGCSLVACDSAGMSILVCNYEEFGNMGGEFPDNVLPP